MSGSLSVLVIDAQDLDLKDEKKKDFSEKLIAIAALLSSVLIYNQIGQLDASFLECFASVSHLMNMLKKSCGGAPSPR
jgi:hypothetical protein